jgi:hypothetical protein
VALPPAGAAGKLGQLLGAGPRYAALLLRAKLRRADVLIAGLVGGLRLRDLILARRKVEDGDRPTQDMLALDGADTTEHIRTCCGVHPGGDAGWLANLGGEHRGDSTREPRDRFGAASVSARLPRFQNAILSLVMTCIQILPAQPRIISAHR